MERKRGNNLGFTLIEVIVATAVFLIFAVGIYSTAVFLFKIVYQSRMTILESAVLSEELEIARNIPYENIGIEGGAPPGILQHTKTISRDGAQFTLVTTVRNIDDPFDGVMSGNPTNDLSPADFKLVEISAICVNCSQQSSVVLSTQIGPKGLEGATKNGALFIHVFGANGQPVPGANVHISSAASSPPVSIDDTTGNDGYLRVVDTPTGTASYAITVSKNGYSSDYTVTSTAQNPNPIKPPANVVSQQITDISFSIDNLSSLAFHTMSQACAPIGGVGFNLQGTKLLGAGPDVYKYSQNFATDGAGDLSLSNMEWDTYDASLTGNTYDIAGTIPITPFYLIPDSSQEVTVILRAHSSNSLLVKVEDAGTKLPLSLVTARLTGNGGYDKSVFTGLSYVRQTDWSGGPGFTTFLEGRYFSDDGNIVNDNPAGDVILKKTGQNYRSDGWFESATFDLGTTVNYRNVILSPTTQPSQSGSRPVLVHIATSNSSSPPSWDFLGPDGTANTYYSPTSTLINNINSGKRYLRYRAYLHTDHNKYTPTFSEIAFTYTDSCIPPGQTFFDTLSAGAYTLTLSLEGYVTSTTAIDVSGATDILVPLAEQQ